MPAPETARIVNRLIETPVTRLAWFLGTGLGSGLFPLIPATAASAVALAIYWWSPLTGGSTGLFLLIGIGFLVGVWATGSMSTPTRPDPRHAVWDEFVGMWATCLFLPKTLPWMIAAFFCFRAFDILKPWPIRRMERFPGGWGIMADDLLAAVFGAVLLNVIRLVLANYAQ